MGVVASLIHARVESIRCTILVLITNTVCGNLQELDLDKFITHRVSFSEINKAFEYMKNGEGLRCIISLED